MEDLNDVALIGRLTKDPEMRFTTSGKAVTRFTLANNKRKEGEANFISVKAWGKLAEIVGEHINKGKLVCVQGRLETSTYEKDGIKHYQTEVIADYIKILERKAKDEGETPAARQAEPVPTDDDDIPF